MSITRPIMIRVFIVSVLCGGILWPATPASAQPPPIDLAATLPGETIIVPQLRGLVTVSDLAAVGGPPPAGSTGVDLSRTPLIASPTLEAALRPFLGRPLSFGSLERLCTSLRLSLQLAGQPFVTVYAPPQEVTGGVIRLVVQRTRLEGALRVEGARYFSAQQYQAAAPLVPGEEIDAARVANGIAWLNENPFRRATIVAEAGDAPGTARLTLRIQERRPLLLTAGYNNSGTAVTNEDRITAGLTWANAFGRGDRLGYSFAADPRLEHSRSHSLNYTTVLPSRYSLTFAGAWSRIAAALPAPLTQHGASWQASARLSVPFRPLRPDWTHGLAFTADFKAGDNTLEFASIPVTDNLTHVVQAGASYTLAFPAWGGRNSVALAGFASPGGLSPRNHGRHFDVSRPGARARYGYAKIVASHQRGLGRGWSWSSSLEAQFASGALLGTEQLSGGGSSGVRGYRESAAFGDTGFVSNNELHAPTFNLRTSKFEVFAFADFAALQLRSDRESTDLRSGGIGLNCQLHASLSVRGSYGWQLARLPGMAGASHGHLSASLQF